MKADELIGRSLGHYSITAKVGAGGMGVVYRGRDERLGRDVAIKVLPSDLVGDPRRERLFEREARAAGGLNHPNILTVHDVGRQDDHVYMVTELLEGDSLSGILRRGRIPLAQALEIALQVARGLSAAHDEGIVHRDVKPGNLFVTGSGAVKVLDFGLAKLTWQADTSVGDDQPTATTTAAVVGTVGYMAPEQARAQPVDRRADIWAFGCVVFEMLAGSQAFGGATTSDALVAVLEKEPDWEQLPPSTPDALRTLLRRCLAKDPRQRLRDMGDALLELEELRAGRGATGPQPHDRRAGRGVAWLGVGLATGLALGGALGVMSRSVSRAQAPVWRLSLGVAESAPFDRRSSRSSLAVSPDGSVVAYVSGEEDSSRIVLRRLDTDDVVPLAGSEGAESPMFSPDGKSIAFFSAGELRRVALSGGGVVTVCEAPSAGTGSWGRDDTIVIGRGAPVLRRVAATGGVPKPLTVLDREGGEVQHDAPQVLANGDVLMEVVGSRPGVAVLVRGERAPRLLAEGGSRPRFVPPGYLAFLRDGSLVAARYDLSSARLTADEIAVVKDVYHYDVSAEGTLVYASGRPHVELAQLLRVARDGTAAPVTARRCACRELRVSPDQQRIAVVVDEPDGGRQIWLLALERDTLTPLPVGARSNAFPVWAPDGQSLVVLSNRDGPPNLYSVVLDPATSPKRLVASPDFQIPCDISTDGRSLLYVESRPERGRELRLLSLDHPGETRSLAELAPGATWGCFGPGDWVAYESRQSGRFEVYARSLSGGPTHQLSVDGGMSPRWASGGASVVYRHEGRLLAVAVAVEPAFRAGLPEVVFQWPDRGHYFDVLADGSGVIVAVPTPDPDRAAGGGDLRVVLDWPTELGQRLPVD